MDAVERDSRTEEGRGAKEPGRAAGLRILVVDDEPIVRRSLGDWFREDGYAVETASSAKEALRLVAADHFDMAFVDIKMPGVDGLELQQRLSEVKPEMAIVVMTAYASVESAVRALKAGAYDYITKPFDPEELSHLVRRADEHLSLRNENVRLKERLDEVAAPTPIIGESPAMKHVFELIAAVSRSEATALIRGESGTGKELVARAIHMNSPRRYGPMIVVNCGALAEGVLESELFGHEKGSFTGAEARRKGKFELADGGTIFLDEIGAISPKVQVELLRVLEDKSVTRVGGQKPVPVDFRVIAATNQDLEAMVRAGTFREDLFWRLNVIVIEIPPLRSRPEDIPVLSRYFLDRFTTAMNRRPMTLSEQVLQVLCSYSWPGNVRELQNAIERAVVVGTPPTFRVEDLPVRVTQGRDPASAAPRALSDVEREHILEVLEETAWNVSNAAQILDVDRGTLYNKIRKYELKRSASEGGAEHTG